MTVAPNRAVLAMNLIRYIGDRVSGSGEPIRSMDTFGDRIGDQRNIFADSLMRELIEKKLIKVDERVTHVSQKFDIFFGVDLTLEGWERYEAEKRGVVSASQGFIAMQFGDPDLDSFVNDVIKPATKAIGYDLVDMRDVARAGVIDNLMRTQIRDSAFVIADLTHDNSGAYWEAGYAEGLGKPVIYICEKAKFDDQSTHFDTNHCTTVPWSKDDAKGFRSELIATLRRSLDPD